MVESQGARVNDGMMGSLRNSKNPLPATAKSPWAGTGWQRDETMRGLDPAALAARLAARRGEEEKMRPLVFLDQWPQSQDASSWSLVVGEIGEEWAGPFPRAPDSAALRAWAKEELVTGWISYGEEATLARCRLAWAYDHRAEQWWKWEKGAVAPPSLPPAPLSSFPPLAPFARDCGPAQYQAAVRRAQAYIAAGDIYQVNLAHRFSTPWPAGADSFRLYQRLRAVSPARHPAFIRMAGRQILCASPESFLELRGRRARTRPIKGTRPRHDDPARDRALAEELAASAKERAELLMITDLERNDLGKVCAFGSVAVPQLAALETFAQVHHLVATVEGELRAEEDILTLLAAVFPGGSITGAPKQRAMELIAELEHGPRGLYTGSLGVIWPNGDADWNIIIRTFVIENETIHFHVGAGIVADSQPELEEQETLHKAAGLLQAALAEQE